MNQELNSEMTDEQKERMEKSGMGIGGGLNKGEDELFEKKLTKEEKKAQTAAKKAEREARKAAEKALQDKIAGKSSEDAADAGGEDGEGGDEAAAAPAADAKKGKAAGKKDKKKDKKGGDVEEGGEGQDLLTGAAQHAICTGVLASRKDSRDVKVDSFSISLFGKILFEDQVLELTYGHRCARTRLSSNHPQPCPPLLPRLPCTREADLRPLCGCRRPDRAERLG